MRRAAFPLVLGFLSSISHAQATLFDTSGTAGDSFGQVCDLVGDVNGDGFAEFLVGAWRDDNGTLTDAGSVSLYSGATGALLTTFFGTGASDHMGFGSSSAGDINGDGFGDICAAADEDNVPGVGANAGSATIVSGFDGSVLYTFTGSAAGDLFGWSSAAVGDVDGDGRDDVCISALNDTAVGVPTSAGSLTVFSGATGGVLFQVFGDVVGGQLGNPVARVGDVDGDGHADFGGVQGTIARIFSGATGNELWRRGVGNNGQLGGGIDVNGDGFDDFITGTPGASGVGRVQVYSGFDNTLLHEVFGSVAGDQLGASVIGAGDLDGDGYGDFASGMPGFDGPAGLNTGAVRAFSGRTGAEIFTIPGNTPGDRLGSALGGGHDVNGDGIPDLITSTTTSAKAKVVSMVPQGLVPFGTGTSGCRGRSTLLARGTPDLGNTSFELHASNCGAAPLLLIGDSEVTLGVRRFGALFHLDFRPPPPALGVLFSRRLPDPDPNGSLIAPFPIPVTPALAGRTFVFQVASHFAPGTCGVGLATSRGLRVTLH
jgi:hypothetical protein